MTAGGLIWVPTAPREPGGGDGDLEGTAEISYKAGIAGPVKDNPYLLHTSLFLHLPVFPWEVGWCPVYEHGGSGGSQWREQGRSVTAWGRALWEEKTQVF